MNNQINFNSFVEIYNTQIKSLIETYLESSNNSSKSTISETEATDLYEMLTLNGLLSKLNEVQRNGYFMNYTVENGIREQFDILRFSENSCLNIELKSKLPKKGIMTIKNQLIRHSFILNTLKKDKVICLTYLRSENKFYMLNSENDLEMINIDNIVNYIEDNYSKSNELKDVDLTKLVISPYSQPEDFSQHRYFLTDEQLLVRNKILDSSYKRMAIIGGPGTGKTLVLFDLAKKYMKEGKKPLILFSAKLPEANQISQIIKVDVKSIQAFQTVDFNEYDVVLVDESQRLWRENYRRLISLENQIVIFSGDHKQTLHPNEVNTHIENKLLENPDIDTHELKYKIRTDEAMSSFIKNLLDLNKVGSYKLNYSNVNTVYFKSQKSAREYIRFMHQYEGFTPIELTEYITKQNRVTKRSKIYRRSEDSHSVIGKEFENVLIPIDNHFYYAENGKFKGKLFSNYSNNFYYPYIEDACLFEALSRTKRNLLLVIVNNPKIYLSIQEILNNNNR